MKRIILIIVIAALSFTKTKAQVNVQDSLALVDLYDSTDGANWSNWNLNMPVNTWAGVTITNGRVTVLHPYSGLNGTLPTSLGNLTALVDLRIIFSPLLKGRIPSSLGNLINLQFLYIYNNQLSDSIPSTLGNLINLKEFALIGDELTGNIPSSLGNLINLTSFGLRFNHLSGDIPSSLGNLKNLNTLELDSNQLSGNIPSSLSNLINLQTLTLNSNNLSGTIPDSLGNLSHLNGFYAYNNQLNGPIPSNLTHLSQMSAFDIERNKFNFDGMEDIQNNYGSGIATYAPQGRIPIHYNNNILSVSAGGTLSNNTYKWYNGNALVASKTGDSTFAISSNGLYSVAVTNSVATQLTLYSDTLLPSADSLIVPPHPQELFANRAFTAKDGWINYYFDNFTPNDYTDDILLLSLNTNGQNIGTIGDGTFALKLAATAGAGSNSAIELTNPLITNPTGFYVMNRYWQVTPTKEPTTNVGVRFYYNKQDLADVNGSYPTHNLTNQQLIFYKEIGGNPDPTTNLAGATAIISIMPGSYASDTTWTYHQLTDTTQYAEFSVAGFSGGGGGGTGNDQSLPLKLLSFTATKQNNGALLQWATAQEVNTSYFEVERSTDNLHFTDISKVNAKGSLVANNYSFMDNSLPTVDRQSSTVFYRLKMFDKNGNYTLSEIRPINISSVFTAIIYPNPVKDNLSLSLTVDKATNIQFEIINNEGKIILSKQAALASGASTQTFNTSSLSSGTYYLKMISAEGENELKFVKGK